MIAYIGHCGYTQLFAGTSQSQTLLSQTLIYSNVSNSNIKTIKVTTQATTKYSPVAGILCLRQSLLFPCKVPSYSSQLLYFSGQL